MNKTKKWFITGMAVALLASPVMTIKGHAIQEGSQIESQQAHYKSKLNSATVIQLASKWASTESLIQRGGDYKDGEYKTFQYEGKTYRYLAGSIDSKKELFALLRKSLTLKEAEEFYKNSGIIEHKGKLAQVEADGGSLLAWNNAKATYVKTVKNTEYYRVVVPLGDTGVKSVYIIELQKGKYSWRISELPYLDLDIPGNINPAFQFFNHLLVNPETAKAQFINDSVLNIDQFKKGIQKVEFRELKETTRNKTQVEFKVKFYVELEKTYKGSLVQGENQLYFLIQQTDEMEFKIVSVSNKSHF